MPDEMSKAEIIVDLVEEHFETDTVINIGDWNDIIMEADKRIRERQEKER